jgi:hypothetical protein
MANIKDNVRPGDSIKVTIRNKSRFGEVPIKTGIGYVYSHGGLHNNATLFASIAWADGACTNTMLDRFDSIEKIKVK